MVFQKGNKINVGRHLSEETKKKLSEANKGRRLSPEQCAKISARMRGNTLARGYKHSEETRAKDSIAQQGRKHSEETKKKISETHKGSKNPMHGVHLIGEKNGMYGKHAPNWMGMSDYLCPICGKTFTRKTSRPKPTYCSDQCRSKGHSLKMTGTKLSEEIKQKLSETHKGENNPAYVHGNCRRRYCRKFNTEFKERIRDRFDRKCFLCGTPENGKKLSIHHIDYNKNSICNGQSWAFVPLCNACHLKTNLNRWYWFNYLLNYWAMLPEINFMID